MERKNIYLSLIIVLSSVVIIFLGYTAFQIGAIIPPDVEDESGYCEFYLIDSETGDELEGEILLTNYEDTSELIEIVDTDEEVFVDEDELVLATIYSVNLDPSDERVFLPTTIAPDISGDEDDPSPNTIMVFFLLDPRNVTVNIASSIPDHRIDDRSFNETSFRGDIEYQIELNFNIELRNSYSVYGHSSFVPKYLIPTNSLNDNNSINGFGLWMMFNGTEIAFAETELGKEYTNFYYVNEWNASIILLDPVWDEGEIQDVTFELKMEPKAIYIFQGFLSDYIKTRIQIT